MATTPPKQPNSFPLRMPDDLRTRLEARAKDNNRSGNAEIVAVLSASLDAESYLASVPTDTLIKELATRLDGRFELVITSDTATREGLAPIRATAPVGKSRKAAKS